MTFKGLAWVWLVQRRNFQFIEARQSGIFVCRCVCACVSTCEMEKKKGRECLWVPGDQANLLAGVLDLAFGQQREK